MWEDPIVAEVRRIREDHAAQYNFNLHALCRALKEREQRDPRPKVSLPPEPAKLIHRTKPMMILAEGKIAYESAGDQ